jgi:hypothetical protein
MNTDTPLPPDEPAEQNPPDGAIFDYWLKSAPSQPVTLEILDSAGKLVRRYSSADPLPQPDPELAIPAYWVRPPQGLSGAAGLHRFVWDIHYTPVPGIKGDYPMTAVPHNTPPGATSPWVMPGEYTVVLTVDGQQFRERLTVEMDPRVKTSLADLQKQFELSQQAYEDLLALQPVIDKVAAARAQLKTMRDKASGAQAAKLDAASKELESLEGGEGRRRRRGPHAATLSGTRDSLLQMLSMLQEVDVAPTTQALPEVPKLHQSTVSLIERWHEVQKQGLAPLKIQP